MYIIEFKNRLSNILFKKKTEKERKILTTYEHKKILYE